MCIYVCVCVRPHIVAYQFPFISIHPISVASRLRPRWVCSHPSGRRPSAPTSRHVEMSWRWVLSSWDPCYSQDVFNLKKKSKNMEHPQKENVSHNFLLLPHINPLSIHITKSWKVKLGIKPCKSILLTLEETTRIASLWFIGLVAWTVCWLRGSKLLFLLWIQWWWVRKPSIFKPFPTTNPTKAENRLASCLENHNLKSAKLRTFRTDNQIIHSKQSV